MNLVSLVKSIKRCAKARHTGTIGAVTRHLILAAWRLTGPRPFAVDLTSKSTLFGETTDSCVILANALGKYDFDNMTLVEKSLADGGTFFDIGANIGAYTLIASENPEVHTVSFEPIPDAHKKLSENIERHARSNVRIFQIALSHLQSFVIMTHNGASSTNRVIESGAPQDSNFLRVTAQPLSDFASQIQREPLVIKIDVERHELSVIEGGRDIVRQASIVLVEYGDRPEIVSIMKELGFSGPVYYDALARKFRHTPLPLRQDEIFLNRGRSNNICFV